MALMSLNEAEKQQLLNLAAEAIRHGLRTGMRLAVNAADYNGILAAQHASFVTLERAGQLRGCMGALEAYRALVVDVAENAFLAAFRDPRFPALSAAELDGLDIHISILSPATDMHFSSEQELLQQIKPGVDGLILVDGRYRSTFLPSVWESLPEPVQFLRHLKQKAGLPAAYWSDSLRVSRYTAEYIP
jgi:AmmeMemoRadiSam system protein A